MTGPIVPLGIYDGPTEVQTVSIKPLAEPRTQTTIWTSLVIDNRDYDDAVELWLDGPDLPFITLYLDVEQAQGLVDMLTRDIAKLRLIDMVDPP